MQDNTSFETTYLRYPFAPMVELGLKLAVLFKRNHTADAQWGVAESAR